MLEFVSIPVGQGEPPGCTRCARETPAAYHSTSRIVALIRDAASAWEGGPGPNMALVGPEPFGHPELPALVAACVDAGAERIAVETSGGALAAHRNASGMLYAGVTHLWVRVVRTGEHVEKSEGSAMLAAPAEAGVRAYKDAARESGVPVVVTAVVPVCTHNLSSLPAIVAGLASWGIEGVRLRSGPQGGLPPSAGPVIAAACDTGMVHTLWVETDGTLPLPATHRLHDASTFKSRSVAGGATNGLSPRPAEGRTGV